jgi:two-component system sensor histidine kinase DesK
VGEEGIGSLVGWSVAEAQRWTQGWRRLALASGMLIYPVVTAVWVSQYSSGAAALAGYVIVGAFCCCYVAVVLAVARHSSWSWLFLGVMTALFVAELPFAQGNAFYMCVVVVSWAAALAKRYAVCIVGAGITASIVVPWAVRPWHSGPGWIQALTTMFTALTLYSSFENANAYRALFTARAEVARLASEAERNRVARDLHDLLGHSLTTISVKASLARRLATTGSPSALEEISDVERLARQALADVRAAVSGYREVTVAGELARGRELLRAVGVTGELPTEVGMVDAAYQELFGWAVREGLTNVARHARANRCTVTVSAARVEVQDDGVGASGRERDGNGLTGLRERAEALGARLEAGPIRPKGWRLRVLLDHTEGAGR